MVVHVALAPVVLDRIDDPAVRSSAAAARVPADGYLFEPDGLNGADWAPTWDDPHLVLGTVTEDQQICLDTRTGVVFARSTWDHNAISPVNHDLSSFARCLDVFENSLPFYDTAQDSDITENAANLFTQAIREFGDPTTDEPTSFWQLIIGDIASGDYNAADLETE